jgi:NADH-quinone oxidoreductase E subunit
MNDIVEAILSKYPPNKKEGLIPILQDIQKQQGYLTEELLGEVGRYLNMPSNKVYGVAAYYDQFRFRPLGHYHIKLCRGTACHLFGSSTYLDVLEKQLKVKAGNTTRDRRFSLEVTNCMGACESAPVVRVNDDFYPHVTPEALTGIIRSLKEKAEKHEPSEL